MSIHEELKNVMVCLPQDYYPYGKEERWLDPDKNYPDCSAGCKHFSKLEGELGADWGICINTNSHRFGLLTFEHQAGFNCFESS
jgi:hypothetical protein